MLPRVSFPQSLGALAALLSTLPFAQAATIVDLPTTLTTSGIFQGPAISVTTFTTFGGMTGSSANLLSPSSTATSTSEVFYGAIEGSFNPNNIYRPTVNLNTANMIEIRSRGASTGGAGFPGGTTPDAGGFAGFLLWKSTNFLSAATTFDNTSRITLNLGTAASTVGRYLINIGSNYYVSQNTITGSGLKNSGDLTTMTWLNYDPTSDLFFSSGTTASIVSGGQISGLTGVGLYAATTTGAGGNSFRFNDLEVTAVPEPNAPLLILFGVASLWISTRRFNRGRTF